MQTTDNSAFSGAVCALVIMALLVFGCGRFGGTKNGGTGDEVKNLTIPTIDPTEPIPALSTDAFDALTADVPELAKYREKVLAAEGDAIKRAFDDMRSKSKAASEKSDYAMPQMLTIANRPVTYVEIAPVRGMENDDSTAAQLDGFFNLIPVAKAADIDLSGLGSALSRGLASG